MFNYITVLACNGVAPMSDESGDYVKRCGTNIPCPKGSWCNTKGYCCPHPETSCSSPKSIGHTCLTEKPGTYWYYDSTSETCLPFVYSGEIWITKLIDFYFMQDVVELRIVLPIEVRVNSNVLAKWVTVREEWPLF